MKFPENPTPYQLHKEVIDGEDVWFQHDPTGEGTYAFHWNKISVKEANDVAKEQGTIVS